MSNTSARRAHMRRLFTMSHYLHRRNN